MTVRWRKSSRSGYAGDNCVEIALSVTQNMKFGSLRPQRKQYRPEERRPRSSSRR